MNKMKLTAAIIAAFVIIMGCASGAKTSGPDELDLAIRDATDYLNKNIPKGSKIVILNIQSDSAALSDYIIDELIANAVNDHIFQVVDRQQLDLIRKEQNFQWSGEVDDKHALEIGKFFGAQTIVSGKVSKVAERYRFTIRALNVQTAQVQGQNNFNIAAGKTITALMNSKGGAFKSSTSGGSGTQTGTSGSGGKAAQPAQPTAQPAQTVKAGTYTFWPRVRATRKGTDVNVYLHQIVVKGKYFTIYLSRNPRGDGWTWNRHASRHVQLQDLDRPSRVYTAVNGGESEGTGNVFTFFTFENVSGKRFYLSSTYDANDMDAVFEEINIDKAEYEP